MNRIKPIPLLLLVFVFVSCQKSDKEILNKTISVINNIETVKYTSTLEIADNGKVIMTKSNDMFFDFTDKTADSLKYNFKDEDGELIYNGKTSLQSDNEKKIILIDNNPFAVNPLIATLYPVKKILPKLVSNPDITILRKSDTIIQGQNQYFFEFTLTKSYIDWMQLGINKEIDYDTKFSLFIDKSNYLPKKVISQNGKTGTISRTIENVDYQYNVKQEFWNGSELPKDYATFDEKEYNLSLKNKLSVFVGKEIDDWELPLITDDYSINPSELTGKVVLLEFWFKGCGGCIKAIPGLNKIKNKFKDKEFEMYGIEFIENYTKEDLSEYIGKSKMEYHSLYLGKSIAQKYGIRSAPTFMIIDRTGRIIYAKSGFNEREIIEIVESNI